MANRLIRAITVDGSFRVIAAETTELVRDALKLRPGLSAELGRSYGELLTGAVLMRETMAPNQRLQMVLSRSGAGQIVADTHPPEEEGGARALVRGLWSEPSGQEHGLAGVPLVGEGALLKVVRSLPRGELHQSMTEATGRGISEALMVYLQTSEQVTATLGVSTVLVDGEVVVAGGFVVQLLPELQEAPLAVMTERLAFDFSDLAAFLLRHGASARVLVDELLYGMPYVDLYVGEPYCGCTCSEARIMRAAATLGEAELRELVAGGRSMTLTCEYCAKPWEISASRLSGLLPDGVG